MKRLFRVLFRLFGVVHFLRFWNRKKITILTLHGVAGEHPEANWAPLWPRITPEKLDAVLSQLGKHYEFVSFGNAVDMIAGSVPVKNNSLVLTFDDGYRNNITEAWPVLKKHNAPAIFFVATGFVETNRAFWIDRLDYALQKSPDAARRISANGVEFDLRGLSGEQLRDGYTHLRLSVKNAISDDDEMLGIFASMSESLEKSSGSAIVDVLERDPYASIAAWPDLQTASRDGVTVGSHSVDHFRLDSVPRNAVDEQLVQSKAAIEEKLKLQCDYFCFPNGSFNEFVLQRTKEAGYTAAVSTLRGLNSVGDDLFRLKRYTMPAKATAFDILLAISGFFELPVVHRFVGSNS